MHDPGDLLEENEIHAVFQSFCSKLELERAVCWGWNDRLTTCFGKAYLREGRVQLSSKLWKRATPKERREVVAHELCHISAFDKNGDRGHGRGWLAEMRKCGYPNATRCHKVSVIGIANRHPVFCDCKVHMISPQRFKKLRARTVKYTCNKCGAKLREES